MIGSIEQRLSYNSLSSLTVPPPHLYHYHLPLFVLYN